MTDRPASWSTEGSGIPPGGPGTPPGGPPPPGTLPPPAGGPGAPPPPAAPQRDGPPWERRTGILDLGAMLATVRDVLFDAPRTFGRMVREGGLGGPLVYMLILGSVCGWISQLWGIALGQAAAGLMGDFGGAGGGDLGAFGLDPDIQAFMETPAYQIVQAFLLPAIILVAYFIKTAIFHLLLLVVGGARRPFETTARTVAYADGSVAVFNIIPFCGGFIALVYGLVVTIIGLAATHETTAGRAAAAVLLPLVLCCLCLVAAIMIFAAGIAGMAGGA